MEVLILECAEYGCSWVAGMMYVDDEDLEAVHAAGRKIVCERCETAYVPRTERA